MKQLRKRRGIAIVMSLAMAFTMMPQLGMTAHAAAGDPAMITGTDVLKSASNTKDAQTVYMADKAWRVIGYDGSGVASSADTMTLISAGNLKTDVRFRADWKASDANHYSKSNLKTEVEAVANTFSDGEKEGIVPRTLQSGTYNAVKPLETDCIAGTAVANALLWPLSTKEAETMNHHLRKANPDDPEQNNNRWWLRSPGYFVNFVAVVSGVGDVYSYGVSVINYHGLRPAFNFNLKSAVFTSAAVGGKSSGAVGAESLKSVETNTNDEWKVTVKNGHDSFAVGTVSMPCNSKEASVTYSGAITGNKEYISAIIKDKDGKVKYYGNLKNCAEDTDVSGTVKINVDGKLVAEDTLYIFNEQLNGDKKTDFSSEPKEIFIDHKYGEWKNLDANQHQRICARDASHIEKENHKWDAGEVTKAATKQAEGIKTYTCTVCKGRKAETIPKLTPTPSRDKQYGTDGTPVGPGASFEAAEKAITGLTSDKDIKGSKYAPLKFKSTKQEKSSMKLSWTKNKKAVKYVVYGNSCNAKGKKYKPVKLATAKGGSYNVKKIGKTKVKKGTYYKYIVVALDKNNNVVSTSKTIHVATKGGKVGNHKSVTVKAKVNAKGKAIKKAKPLSKTVLKKGKSLKFKVTLNLAGKKQKVSKHVGVRYESSNTKIATVSGGKIKAKAKGGCTIYVYAQNGVSKQVRITVK